MNTISIKEQPLNGAKNAAAAVANNKLITAFIICFLSMLFSGITSMLMSVYLPVVVKDVLYNVTGKALNELAKILLHDDNNMLSRGEREMIGAYVSSLNDCLFCQHVHGALAQYYFGCDTGLIDDIKRDYQSASISPKLKALLSIAGSVQKGGKYVTPEQIEHAKSLGATDKEIHDTVLIAAAFCMFNRYVDGLNTWAPQDYQVYLGRAPMRAKDGYADMNVNK